VFSPIIENYYQQLISQFSAVVI